MQANRDLPTSNQYQLVRTKPQARLTNIVSILENTCTVLDTQTCS